MFKPLLRSAISTVYASQRSCREVLFVRKEERESEPYKFIILVQARRNSGKLRETLGVSLSVSGTNNIYFN